MELSLQSSSETRPVISVHSWRLSLLLWNTRPTTGCRARSTSLWGSTGASSGNCQKTETCMVRACHTPRQPLQNHPSRHLGGWATPWSAEEMMDGQHQRVCTPAHARTAHKGLRQEKTGRGSLLKCPSCPPDEIYRSRY